VKWFKKKPSAFNVHIPQQEEEGKIDIYSPTWKAISQWATKELITAREFNDKKSLDIIKTSVIRGRISMLKSLLNLPNTEK